MEDKPQIKEAILRATENGESKNQRENGIRRVVWVPKKLDQEVETVRKKIGYTRSGFYRYSATRLLEQMLLSKRKEVHLEPWEEVIGTLQTIETDSHTITAIISCAQNFEIALPFRKGTTEAAAIQNLQPLLGQKIELMKTDDPEKPIVAASLWRNDGSGKKIFTAMMVSLKSTLCFALCSVL